MTDAHGRPPGPFPPPPGQARWLHDHPGWPADLRTGAGWSAPALAEPREIPLAADQAAELEALGIRLRAPPGPGCRLLLDAASPAQRLQLDLSRARGFTLLLGSTARLAGEVVAIGAGQMLAVAGENRGAAFQLRCEFRGEDALLLIGSGASSNHTNFRIEGRASSVLVGDDAMFSSGVAIRTSDSHALIDIPSRARLNAPRPVRIGPHVWLGEGATVMKGVTIGSGSIVAGRAVVTRDVASRTLVGGVPARVIRRNVTWSRSADPTPDQVDAVLRALPDEG